MKGPLQTVFWVAAGAVAAVTVLAIFGVLIRGGILHPKPTMSDYQVRSQAEKVTYDQLMRNFNGYDGEPVTIKGEVVQAGDHWTGGWLRVIVEKDGHTFDPEAVWVIYDHESTILKGDNITVYGIANGRYSYETVMGAEMTVPSIVATSVDR